MSLTGLVLGFETEHFDTVSGFVKVVYLKYFMDDHTIELVQENAMLLKRIFYPDVTLSDLFIGNSFTVYSRVFLIKKYANIATTQYMQEKEVHYLCKISEDPSSLGNIITAASSSKLVFVKARTSTSNVLDFNISRGDTLLQFVSVKGKNNSFLSDVKALGSSAINVSILPVEKISEMMTACSISSIEENCSLCIIKPHAIKAQDTGSILSAISDENFTISALFSAHLTYPMAEDIFDVYKTIFPQYSASLEQLCSGVCLCVMLTGGEDIVDRFREFVGPLNPELARSVRPQSLRARFGQTVVNNAVHCTDLPDDGKLEITYIFKTIASL